MRFAAAPEDFLKGRLVDPGWHPAVISAYTEKTSKPPSDPEKLKAWEGPSAYAEVQFKITDGPFKGTVIYQNFSEKASTFIVPLLEAISKQQIDKSKAFAADVDESKLLNKTVDIHVVRGSWNNKPKNEIDGYKPFTGKAAPATAGV